MSSPSTMRFPAVSLARCALTDRHPPPSPPAERPPVSLEASASYSVDDILQIILKSRRSWKTLKGQPEAVWPPYLEATMLKALQEYEPDDSRETRLLGRYPMRNRFISDYIHATTSKYRSAKQVSSRLQQLRDTAEGRQLIDVLTRCHRTPTNSGTCNTRVPVCHSTPSDPSLSPPFSTISCDSPPPSSSGSPVTPSTPSMPRLPLPQSRRPTEPRMPVFIDILPQQFSWSPTGTSSSSPFPTSTADARVSDAARHISHIDPTVTFVSPSPVNGISSYIVLLDGAPIHSEDTALEYAGPYFASHTGQSPSDQPALYNTPLVPRYWEVLCKAADPTLYTIVQDVYQTPDPAPARGLPQRARRVRIFSAIYHFRYSSSAHSSAGQSPMETSSSGSSVTSVSVEPSRASLFPIPPMYAGQVADGPRTPGGGVDQNLFDEPFMLDVNFDQISFDDIFINMDNNASDGAFPVHFFSKDPPGFT